MIDRFSISLWLTDAVLLGLAYMVGRVHGGVIANEQYTRKLSFMIDEVKLLRKRIDRLADLHTATMEKKT